MKLNVVGVSAFPILHHFKYIIHIYCISHCVTGCVREIQVICH